MKYRQDIIFGKKISRLYFYLFAGFIIISLSRLGYIYYREYEKEEQKFLKEISCVRENVDKKISAYLTLMQAICEQITDKSLFDHPVSIKKVLQHSSNFLPYSTTLMWKNLKGSQQFISSYGPLRALVSSVEVVGKEDTKSLYLEKICGTRKEKKGVLILKAYLPSLLPKIRFFNVKSCAWLASKKNKISLQNKIEIFIPSLRSSIVLERLSSSVWKNFCSQIADEVILLLSFFILLLVAFYKFSRNCSEINKSYFADKMNFWEKEAKTLLNKWEESSREFENVERKLNAAKASQEVLSFLVHESRRRQKIALIQIKEQGKSVLFENYDSEDQMLRENFLSSLVSLKEEVSVFPLTVKTFSVESLMADVLKLITSRCYERYIDIDYEQTKDFNIITDKLLFLHLTSYLLWNSIERSKKNGKIKIRVDIDKSTKKHFFIKIEDNGFILKDEDITRHSYSKASLILMIGVSLKKDFFLKVLSTMQGTISFDNPERNICTLRLPIFLEKQKIIETNDNVVVKFPGKFKKK